MVDSQRKIDQINPFSNSPTLIIEDKRDPLYVLLFIFSTERRTIFSFFSFGIRNFFIVVDPSSSRSYQFDKNQLLGFDIFSFTLLSLHCSSIKVILFAFLRIHTQQWFDKITQIDFSSSSSLRNFVSLISWGICFQRHKSKNGPKLTKRIFVCNGRRFCSGRFL